MTKTSKELLSAGIEGDDMTQDENLTLHEAPTKSEATNPRRISMSKREIMDQLSRERFPWDE